MNHGLPSLRIALVLPLTLAGMPARAGDPEPAPDVQGTPRVHLEVTRNADVKLYEVTAELSVFTWRGPAAATFVRPVCTAPCGVLVDGRAGQPFYINGESITRSRKFTLDAWSGDIVARVRPGHVGLRIGGIVVMGLGGAAGVGGMFALNARTQEDWTPAPTVAFFVTGALIAAGGLAMFLLGRTRVSLSQRRSTTRANLHRPRLHAISR